MPRRKRQRRTSTVFLNCPFDKKYEPLYLAQIAGLCGLGLVPRSVLELPGRVRLDKLLSLIRSCDCSLNDLSRVELAKGNPPCPRFNMPFELGLAVAVHQFSKKNPCYVLESRKYRLQKSLSDANGFDPFIHRGKPLGVLQVLTNIFHKPNQPTVAQLKALYKKLNVIAEAIKKNNRTSDLYSASGFKDIVLAAVQLRRRIIEPRGGRRRI